MKRFFRCFVIFVAFVTFVVKIVSCMGGGLNSAQQLALLGLELSL
jgi:hypothetical protein